MLERRAASIEFRTAGRRLEGHAAVFNVEAKLPGFTETILPGAFASSLRSGGDILGLLDHDQTRLLGRTRSGTLKLSEDSKGLSFSLDLPSTSVANDVLALAQRNDLGGMSFGFTVPKDGEKWTGTRRELRAVKSARGQRCFELASISANKCHCPITTAVAVGNGAAIFGDSLVGLLRKIADTFDPVETRTTTWPWWPLSNWLGAVEGGRVVNARTSENLSTVLACVSAISSAISSLPAFVYRVTDVGREEDNTHPLARLIRNGPNQRQTWPDFLEWLVASTLLRGNGLVEIVTDGGGRVIGLIPIPWEFVSVQLLPNGRLAYDIVATTGFYGSTGKLRRLLEGEVLHLRDRSDDGLVGRSRLSRAGAVVSTALAIQEFSGALYENSANPSGVLQAEGKLNDEQLRRLADHFRQTFAGPSRAAKALVLDQGLEWKSVSISPEDAELLASRRFTGEELARLYNVPPPIVGDLTHGTFTNSETLIRFFAQSTLTGWCRKIEAEFHRSVLSEASRIDRQFVLDLSGLLRGDPETRWKSHEIALRNQVLTPNEVRGEEGWNPRPGGDEFPAPARTTPPNFGAA